MISDVLCMLYVVTFDSIVDVVAGSFSFSYISDSTLTFLGFTVMEGILSLMPFAVSMNKKLIPSAVVTAVVISALMQPVIGRDPQFKETLIKLVVVTLIVLFFAAHTIIKRLNYIDDVDVY